MNICFLEGKMINEIDFQFIIKVKKKAITRFKIELENKDRVKIKAYNSIADWCYCNLKKGDTILLEGSINSDGKIEVEEVELENNIFTKK